MSANDSFRLISPSAAAHALLVLVVWAAVFSPYL